MPAMAIARVRGHVTCARLLSGVTGGQPEAWSRPCDGVASLRPRRGRTSRSPASTLVSRASPVTGCYGAQPLRCDIVAVLTVTM